MHCPPTAYDLTQIFDRGELHTLIVVARVEHQSNFAIPISRSPEKIILMPGNRRWQPELGTEEINRSSLAVVLAEDSSALLIFGTQVIINMPDRCDHFLPAKLIGEKLGQRSGMRSFGAGRLLVDGSHVRDQFAGRQNWYGQWRK